MIVDLVAFRALVDFAGISGPLVDADGSVAAASDETLCMQPDNQTGIKYR